MAKEGEEETSNETIDDTIAETYKEILAREQASDTPTETLDVDKPDVAAETKEQKAERARDEAGRFAKQEKAEKAEKVPQEQAGKASPKVDSPATAPAAAEPVLRADGLAADLNRPPAGWKPGAKAKWGALDPEVRAEIHRREVDAYKKFSESAPEAELGRNIKALGDRYHQVITMDGGGDVSRAVGAFFQTASLLRFGTPQQKRQAIDYLEQNYAVPPREMAAPQVDPATGQPVQQRQQQPFQDPRVDTLMANWNAQEQQRRTQSDAAANDATTRFLSATNEKGESLYPFVDNVLDDMTGRVQAIRARNPGVSHDEALKQAYDAASWANPEVRKILQEQEVARLEAQRREVNLRKVDSARQAAAGNVSKRGTVPAQAPVGTMDDTILQTYRDITSR